MQTINSTVLSIENEISPKVGPQQLYFHLFQCFKSLYLLSQQPTNKLITQTVIESSASRSTQQIIPVLVSLLRVLKSSRQRDRTRHIGVDVKTIQASVNGHTNIIFW